MQHAERSSAEATRSPWNSRIVLEPIGPEIWGWVTDYRLGALTVPHRMTVMRGAHGGLLVHSPAKPDAATRASLDALGPVEAIVWPSWWHDLYLRAWAAAYRSATLYVAPGLRGAARSLPNAVILAESTHVSADVDQIFVDPLGVNFDEFVFFHRPSGALVVADLVVNVHGGLGFSAKILFRLMGAYPAPRIPWCYRLVIRDRRELRAKLDRVLAWDFDRLVVGHGDVILSGAKTAFAKTCDDLLR